MGSESGSSGKGEGSCDQRHTQGCGDDERGCGDGFGATRLANRRGGEEKQSIASHKHLPGNEPHLLELADGQFTVRKEGRELLGVL